MNPMTTMRMGAGSSKAILDSMLKRLSNNPPKYADRAAAIVPQMAVVMDAHIAIKNVGLAAASSMLNTSLPRASVPREVTRR